MSEPLALLHSCFSNSWGGLEIQALETARRLRDRGHRVVLACPGKSRICDEGRALAVEVLPLSVGGYLHPSAIRALAAIMKARGIECIHCHHSRDIATVVPSMLLSGRRIPIILTKSMGSAVLKRDLLHRFTYAHVRRVLAVSRVIRDNVIATTPVPGDRVTVFPYGVDLHRFRRDAVARSRFRSELGIGEDQVLVGFAGRFTPGKGLEDLLDAARMVADAAPHVRFLVAGEASYGEEAYAKAIAERAERLRLGSAVRFIGFRTDIRAVMGALDVFAFPSHAEAFGIVLIEAMAMECPVVSTNCDGVLDIVVDGVTGIMVPPRSPGDLARALMKLALDGDLRRTLGAAGRRRVEARFTLDVLDPALEEIYREESARG